jgi:hypothetical protein
MNLKYARWLGLPILKLKEPRQLFNVDKTENKAGYLEYYMVIQLQLGNKKHRHLFYLTNLGNNHIILGYP